MKGEEMEGGDEGDGMEKEQGVFKSRAGVGGGRL